MTAQKSRLTPTPAKLAESDGTEVTPDTITRKKSQNDGAEVTPDMLPPQSPIECASKCDMADLETIVKNISKSFSVS